MCYCCSKCVCALSANHCVMLSGFSLVCFCDRGWLCVFLFTCLCAVFDLLCDDSWVVVVLLLLFMCLCLCVVLCFIMIYSVMLYGVLVCVLCVLCVCV